MSPVGPTVMLKWGLLCLCGFGVGFLQWKLTQFNPVSYAWPLQLRPELLASLNAGGVEAPLGLPPDPRSLSVAWLMLCAHSSVTFIVRYMLLAPPGLVPGWTNACKMDVQMEATALEPLMRSGGLFKHSWQTFLICFASNIHNEFCFLSQKLFVQIQLCGSCSSTINRCHSGRIRCGLYPSRFVCLWCGCILRDAWLLCSVLNSLPTYTLSFTRLSNTAEV